MTNTETKFWILKKGTPMPCKGRYCRVAILEVEAGFSEEPSMISPRARGVIRVVDRWEKLNDGKTSRCEAARALKEAEEMALELAGGDHSRIFQNAASYDYREV